MTITPIKQKILDYIESNPGVNVKRIIDYTGLSKQAIAKHLRELLQDSRIYKAGSPPFVAYFVTDYAQEKIQAANEDKVKSPIIEQNFFVILADGRELRGLPAFVDWCKKRNFDPASKAKEYESIWKNYQSFKDSNGLIDATAKGRATFGDEFALDKLYYGEFSALEIFGKTEIYSLLLYAKQSQDKKLIKRLIDEVKDKIYTLIIREKFDAVGFIPPTIKRNIQLMKEMERILNLPLPTINIVKIRNQIVVAQKNLSKPEDRIQNAQSTFVINDDRQFKNILLIDDFVGSASTLNFVAQKIRRKNSLVERIVGFAVAGTPNGVVNNQIKKFEVINEP